MWVPESDADYGQDGKDDWIVDETTYERQQAVVEDPIDRKDVLDPGDPENSSFEKAEIAQTYPFKDQSHERSKPSKIEETDPWLLKRSHLKE